MKLHVESVLNCPPEAAWEEVQSPGLLAEVMSPLLRFAPRRGEKMPERWTEGSTLVCRLYKFGIIPLGKHTIHFDRVDPESREIQTREHSWLAPRWDHRISIQPTADGRTRYADDLEVGNGLLSPLVWLFGNFIYHYRQRRWRRVAKRLAGSL